MQTTLRFLCYYCRRVHTVEYGAAGRRGRCLCGKLMVVPDLTTEIEPWNSDSMPVALPAEEEFGGAGHPSTGSSWGAEGHEALPHDSTVVALPETDSNPSPRSSGSESAPVTVSPATGGSLVVSRPLAGPTSRRWGALFLGTAELLLSLPILAWAILQTTHAELPAWREITHWMSLPHPEYLGLPAQLWSTLLFALFVTLFVDGFRRLCRGVEKAPRS